MRPGIKKGMVLQTARALAPRLAAVAPEVTSAFIRQALTRAVNGVGPLPPAQQMADEHLRKNHGDVDGAIHDVIEQHVRYALAEGFVTNLGGLVTAAVVAPANIAGLALLQCRMVAGIVHLRGYDLTDARAENAILVTLLGPDNVRRMVKQSRVPAPPMALATAPETHPDLNEGITQAVASEMITRVVGKRMATTLTKRTPVVGGLVGAGADGISTWQVGRYADREFLPR